MDKAELGALIYRKTFLRGEFVLRSGKKSTEYFDKYLFESDPYLLTAISESLIPLIPQDTEILAGLELGGVPLATALSLKTGLSVVFVRKEAKKYGTAKLAEGCELKDKRIFIIEDVITTGGQVIESALELRKLGANVENVLCVILRETKAVDNLARQNLNLHYLFKMEDLKSGKISSRSKFV